MYLINLSPSSIVPSHNIVLSFHHGWIYDISETKIPNKNYILMESGLSSFVSDLFGKDCVGREET